jgi:hypothetical protein
MLIAFLPVVQISEHIERLVTLLKGDEPAELDEDEDPVEVGKGLHLTANPSTSTTAGVNVNEGDDEDNKIEEV